MQLKLCLVCAYYAPGIDRYWSGEKYLAPQEAGCERFLLKIEKTERCGKEG